MRVSFDFEPACVRIASDPLMFFFAQQEGFSTFYRVAGGLGSGTHKGHTYSGNDNDGGDHGELPLLPSQSMSPVPFAEDSNKADELQGRSPCSWQGTFSAQFRSPCSQAHQSTAGIERSIGSVFDATSPRCSGMGVEGSILSPGDSVNTASSPWMREGGPTAGAWKENEEQGGEDVNWGDGGDGERGGMGDKGDSKMKDWGEGEEEQSNRGRPHFGLLDEEEGRVASAAPEDDVRYFSSRQAQDPASR